MKNDRSAAFQAFGLAAIAFGFYVSFLSKSYVFEGLLRAMPIETGRWTHLFAANYLLYGPLGLMFHGLLQLLGFSQPAVISLQIMDALIGAAGLGVFFLLLRKLEADAISAILWTTILGCSLGYALWSTEAENYIFSTFLLLVNFFFLVKYVRGEIKDPKILGILHALAVLGHIVNVAFGAVILWVLYRTHQPSWSRPALRYAVIAIGLTAGIYLSVIFFVQKPEHLAEVIRWSLGSAGAAEDGTVALGGGFSLIKTWEWVKMSLHVLVSFSPVYEAPPGWGVSKVLLKGAVFLIALFSLVILIRAQEIYRRSPAIVGGCAIWMVVYACVFLRWQPWTMVYRVSDLIPMGILAFLAYQSIPRNRGFWRGLALTLAVCLAVGNLGAEIYPRSFASNNPHLERMTFLKAHTGEADWVTGDSGHDEIYIPYFAERRPIVMERFARQPERLDGFLKHLLTEHQDVWVTSRILAAPQWRGFFNRYTLEKTAEGPDGFTLYRLRSYHG
jgi:hypothetical protein